MSVERNKAAALKMLEAVGSRSAAAVGVSLLYADTRADNGLFSEYVLLGEGGRKFFDAVPRS